MKTVILDCWHDQFKPEYIHSVSAVQDDKDRFFSNNLNPPTHFIEVWKMADGRTNQVNSLFGSVLPSSKPKPIEKLEDYGDNRTIAMFKIRPRH